MAANLGITGIVVSNHRGMIAGRWTHRDCLVNIVEAVGDEIDILFDSGIRYGSDIAKAMAIGAKMVLIGRLYIYGLVLGEEECVGHVLCYFLGDLTMNLHLAGIPSVSQEDLKTECLKFGGLYVLDSYCIGCFSSTAFGFII